DGSPHAQGARGGRRERGREAVEVREVREQADETDEGESDEGADDADQRGHDCERDDARVGGVVAETIVELGISRHGTGYGQFNRHVSGPSPFGRGRLTSQL